MKKDNSKLDLNLIRQKAEELCKKKTIDIISNYSNKDVNKLIHELEVHQIELEMINEELLASKQREVDLATGKYIELYDFAPSGYFTLSKESDIINLNFSGAEMLGAERSNLINSNFSSFISKDSKPTYQLFFDKIIKSNLKEFCEIQQVSKTNQPVFVYLSGIFSKDENEVLLNVVDITDRKRKEESLLKMRKAINASSQVVFITDKEGIITFINPEFTKLYGYEADEIIGKTTPRILKSGLLTNEFYTEFWNTLLFKENIDFCDIINKRKDGSFVDVAVTASPILDDLGTIIGFVGMHKDMTERKKVEKELLISKEKAEESDRLKSAFLANMSHEIRTPMNGILGFSSLLKEPELSGDKQKKYIEIIEKSGERMLNTINDIIDISKIESNQMLVFIQETDIIKKLNELYSFFKPQCLEKGLILKVNNQDNLNSLIIKTDKNKFDSILTNLIKNAIKYTDEGGITLGCVKKENTLEFSIKDTGIGIPVNRQQAIFNRFEQADIEDERALQGSGLGLAITKAYVEMLGGNIWLESEIEQGSVFYFTIPISQEATPIEDVKKEDALGSIKDHKRKLNILIAEDDEQSSLFLNILVEPISKNIFSTVTGPETLELCKKNPDIDLILMDIQMPGLNGLEVTQKIREFNKKTVIIAQTAFAMAADEKKVLNAGCNAYISKPIQKEKLMNLINRFF